MLNSLHGWEQFHFLRSEALWCIPAWFIFLRLFYWLNTYRENTVNEVCDERLIKHISKKSETDHKKKLNPWYHLAIILSIIALAGPAWRLYPRPLMTQDSPLVIALDVSYSMDADDIKPSRLQRAKHKIVDLLTLRPEGHTGLIIFSQHAFVVTPLSTDTQTLLSLLNSIDTQLMPTQGSRPDRAVASALELISQTGLKNGQIVLITDDISETSVNGIKAIKPDIPVSILDVSQESVPIPRKEGGLWMTQDQKMVLTERHPERLKKLAHDLNGIYQNITADDKDIEAIINNQGVYQLDYKELDERFDVFEDEGPKLLWFALPLLLIGLRRKWI